MLGSEVLAVRLAGIYALQQLAAEYPMQFHIRVMRLFCAFVVQCTTEGKDDSTKDAEDLAEHMAIRAGPDSSLSIRADVQAAMEAVRTRGKAGIRIEKTKYFRLGLSTADLRGLRLMGANLSNAALTDVDMSGSYLSAANLSHAWLDGAKLSGADIFDANLTGTVFVRPDSTDQESRGLNRNPATGLTQVALDDAGALAEFPPYLDGVTDADTGKPLVWQGRVIDNSI